MNKIAQFTYFLLLLLSAKTTFANEKEKFEIEKEAIKTIIESAYIDGLQNKRDFPAIKKGLVSGFNLIHNKQDKIVKVSRDNWIAKMNPKPPKLKTEYKLAMIDITDDAAIAKVELFRNGKQVFTDYMSLYKLNTGWKIVSKIYHRHE